MLSLVIAFGLRSQENSLGINRPDVVWDHGELYMWVDEETAIRIADILDYHDILVSDLDYCRTAYARLKSLNEEVIEVIEETNPDLAEVVKKLQDVDDGVSTIVSTAIDHEKNRAWIDALRTVGRVAAVVVVAVLSFKLGQSTR